MRFKGVATAAGFSVAILLLVGGTALAKGDGVKQITITGGGLEHRIEISDPITLDQFNPWGGLHRFIGGPVDEGSVGPETLAGPYKVRFLLDVHEWVYEFSYYTVDGFETGYIVLPEPNGDSGYRFVIPAGWYRSSDAWREVMSERLVGEVAPRSGGELSVPKIDGILLALGLVGAVAVAFRRKVEGIKQQHPTRQDP
ncbi:MAG: hypothetical protein ABR609_03285 [Acidimicrobiia bacterium]